MTVNTCAKERDLRSIVNCISDSQFQSGSTRNHKSNQKEETDFHRLSRAHTTALLYTKRPSTTFSLVRAFSKLQGVATRGANSLIGGDNYIDDASHPKVSVDIQKTTALNYTVRFLSFFSNSIQKSKMEPAS